jgi:sugar lactone lactonase YvrE
VRLPWMSRTARRVSSGRGRRGAVAGILAVVALLLWATLAGGTQPFDTYESTVAADSPAAQYRLSDTSGSSTLADSAGSNTASNSGITLGGEGPFPGSKSGAFGGSSYASLTSNPLAGATSFTVEAWVNWTGGASYKQPIFDFGSGPSNYMYLTPASAVSGHKLQLEIHPTTGAAASVTATKLKSSNWEYVAATETSGGTLTLYVNGEQVGQSTLQASTPTSLGTISSLYVGKSLITEDPSFNGSLSNIAFYTKALSEAQLKAHYNAGEFPVNTTQPTISGTPKDEGNLTAHAESWTGLPTIAFSYQWLHCEKPAACTNIPSAVGKTYEPVHVYIGEPLKVQVTGVNTAGSGTASSVETAPVAAIKPANTALPTIAGTAEVGKKLMVTTGSWKGSPVTEYLYQWRECSNSGEACKNISGATQATYRIAPALLTHTIRAEVTAKNSAGGATATSAQTAVVNFGIPDNETPPVITGATQDKKTLTASTGTWAGTGTMTYAYQWKRCNSAGEGCTTVPVTTATYGLGPSDVGSTMSVVVTATNAFGSTPETSAATAVVTAAPPANSAPPTISGTAQDGQTLTTSQGTWTGTPTIAYAYRWERCNSSGESCVEIASATASTYKAVPGDVGHKLRATVAATNSAGGTAAASAPTGVVTALAAANSAPPTISGTAQDGQTLRASEGTWTGTPTITYAYEWERCDASGSSCAPVEGATDSTYGVGPDDVGATLRVEVTASNAAGSTPSSSAPTSVVTAVAPTNTELPTISGLAEAGQTLTADHGIWSGTPTIAYGYQWERCDTLGESCLDISGATGASYELNAFDVGATVRVLVTAENGAGSQQNASAPTTTVTSGGSSGVFNFVFEFGSAGSEPGELERPGGVAVAADGDVWVADQSNSRVEVFSPSGEFIKEFGSNGSADGQLSAPDGLAIDAEGHIWVLDTGNGRIEEFDESGTFIQAAGSGELGSPEGIAVDADGNVWVSDTYSARLLVFNAAGEHIRTVESASHLTEPEGLAVDANGHVWVADWSGKRVTEFDEEGTYLGEFGTEGAGPGEMSGPFAIAVDSSGHVFVGEANNDRVQEFAEGGEYLTAIGSAGTEPGELELGVPTGLALDSAGDLWVADTNNARVAEWSQGAPVAPSNTTPPVISGDAEATATLTAHAGNWSGSPSISYVYQWQHCSAAGEECTDIEGATEDEYELGEADVGSTLRVVVTATNPAGSAEAVSAASSVIAPESPPANTTTPTISGSPETPATLTADPGEWTGALPLSYAYQWQRCNATGEACVDIEGATGAGYELGEADLGSTLRVVVTASNGVGSADAASAPSGVVSASTGPVNEALPAITGTLDERHRLSATEGTWRGATPISYAYQWKACDADGENCESIFDAVNHTYPLSALDVGGTVRVEVIATNPSGSTVAISAPTEVVGATPPTAELATTISGVAQAGQTLTASARWSGTPPLSYSYQWQRCNSSGGSCTDIAGATGSTYVVAYGDIGYTLRVESIATNSAGFESSRSSASGVVTAAGWIDYLNVTALDRETDLRSPSSVAIAPDRTIWAIDSSNDRMVHLTATGAYLGSFALFYLPGGVAVDSHGDPWVANSREGRVVEFDEQGEQIGHISGAGLERPNNLAFDKDGNVWISDGHKAEVLEFDEHGEFIQSIGSSGSGPGQFGEPTAIAIDSSGEIVVVDRTYSRIERFDDEGHFIDEFGTAGSGDGALKLPDGLAIDNEGDIFVTDTGNSRVEKFNAEGAYLDQFGVPGSAAGQLANPGGLAIDAHGHVWLADLTNNRLEEWLRPVAASNVTGPRVYGQAVPGGTLSAGSGTWLGDPASVYSFQWQTCTAAGEECENMAGAVGRNYEVQIADVGRTLRTEVTASNVLGSTTVASAPSEVVATAVVPANSSSPTISGKTQDGQVLSAQPGAWSKTPRPEYSYQWQSCSAAGEECEDIYQATDSSYTAGSGDRGATLRVVVTASNSAGTGSATSAASAVVEAGAPTELEAPSIAGDPALAETLSASAGTWGGTETEIAYQWQRCDTSGHECTDIESATSADYKTDEADLGSTLRVKIGAGNEVASVTAASPATAVVEEATTIQNTWTPSLAGTPQEGQALVAGTGSWLGLESLGYAYRWQRCDIDGNSCHNIAGATGSTYQPSEGDVGGTVRVVVTASELGASATETSPASPVIAGAGAPVVEQAPSATGTPLVGYTLTASPGAWSGAGALSYAYQWQRCDADGEACEAIGSATAGTYTLVEGDADSTIRVLLSATDEEGRTSDMPSSALLVSATDLKGVSSPALAGVFQFGRPVSAVPGIWTGDGSIGFAYQWERCDEGGESCAPITGQTNPEYTPGEADIGSTLELATTATSTSATATETSQPSPVIGVEAIAPEEVTAPSIEGATTRGEVLTVHPGTWLSTETISYSYQWERCTEEGETCVDIEGADSETYELAEADLGATLEARVTATNALGSETAGTPETGVVWAPGPPEELEAPPVSGTAQQGEKLVVGEGEWSGSRPLSFAWQWQRCDSAGESCTAIEGAEKSSYELTGSDVGHTLRAKVTATNSLDSAEAVSSASDVIVAAGEAETADAVEAAERTDPSVLAPSTEADIEEHAVHPAIEDSGEQLSATDMLNSSWISKDAPGESSIDTQAGVISMAPVATSAGATRLPTVVNDAAAIYANTQPETDTIVRPGVLGSTTLLQMRAPSAPTSFTWELGLTPEEHLVQLSDGSVAVTEEESAEEEESAFSAELPDDVLSSESESESGATTGPDAGSESGDPLPSESAPGMRSSAVLDDSESESESEGEAPEGEDEGEEEPPSSEPLPPAPEVTSTAGEPKSGELQPQNTEAGYEDAQSVLGEAEEQEANAVMVIHAHAVKDAAGNTVPVSLSIEDETLTMTVSPGVEVTYPLTAELTTAARQASTEPHALGLRRAAATHHSTSSAPEFGLWEPHAEQLDKSEENGKPVPHFDRHLKNGPLHITTARLALDYNTPASNPVLKGWLSAAASQGLRPYITLEECEPSPHCPGKPPTLKTYKRLVQRLMKELPQVKVWGAWNEPDNPNFPMHPLAKAPMAAFYWQEAQQAAHNIKCGCKVIAGEFTEVENNVKEAHERYISIYINTLLKVHRYWNGNPTYLGLHDYQDLVQVSPGHPYVTANAQKFIGLSGKLNNPQMWITEAGAAQRVGGHKVANLLSEKHCTYPTTGPCKNQELSAKDFLHLRDVSANKGKVHFGRIYYSLYRGPTASEFKAHRFAFDSAMLDGDGGEPGDWRPAYCVLAFAGHSCPPGSKTDPSVGAQKATAGSVAGVITSQGLPTSAWLEYGTDDSYGQATAHISLPAGSGPQTQTFALHGLEPCTTYHYQVEAENESSEGTPSPGGDETFTTKCETEALRQDWESGMESELPSSTEVDPHTGEGDRWLLEEVATGGSHSSFGFAATDAVAAPSASRRLGARAARAKAPVEAKAFSPFSSALDDASEEAPGDLWHVQENPNDISVSGAISPQLVSLPEGSSLPAPTSGTHAAWFGDPLSGTFCVGFTAVAQLDLNGCESNAPVAGALVSPPFSLEGDERALLHFKSWFDIEAVQPNAYDDLSVEYTTDSGTSGDPFVWHQAASLNPAFRSDDSDAAHEFSNNGLEHAPSWSPTTVDLGSVAGADHVRIRFVFNSVDQNFNGFRGWLIDDVHVLGQQDEPVPQIDGVTPCGRAGWGFAVLRGSGFVEGSSVAVDGRSEPVNVLSSERIEMVEPSPGEHTIEVIGPDGETSSNSVSVTQSTACPRESIS